jgi:NitT/TauT family transport system substrate-binding protein
MVSRHSAFYSPLIAALAPRFLGEEGLDATYAVSPPGSTVFAEIASGRVDVAQSAVSGSWSFLEKGQTPPVVHFAQINRRDGFLIASRRPQSDFTWDKLTSGPFMFVHGGQPQAMLAYAMKRKGVDLQSVPALDRGGTESMLTAFRDGEGEYFHEQAPAPQQLALEGHAHIVASVGDVIGEVAFSSLCASRQWVETDTARRFTRAYRRAREWVNQAPPGEVAHAERDYFVRYDERAVAQAIEYYQRLHCWDGDIAVPRHAYEVALDVFEQAHLITTRHAYGEVVTAPPEG